MDHRRLGVSIAFRRSALPALDHPDRGFIWLGRVSIAFRRSALPAPAIRVTRSCRLEAGLHCLSAFCPPGSPEDEARTALQKVESPLPFGVLPSRLKRPTPSLPPSENPVSIAFRRSALPAQPARRRNLLSRTQWSPLPFGVLPSRLDRRGRQARDGPSGLHCLSAFCPPGSNGWSVRPESCKTPSPLPFGVLPSRLNPGFG
jgi:hypothetical protein